VYTFKMLLLVAAIIAVMWYVAVHPVQVGMGIGHGLRAVWDALHLR
jgi:hypothetical protein